MKTNKKKNNIKNDKINLVIKIMSYILLFMSILSLGFIIYFDLLPVAYLILFIAIIGVIVFGLFKLLNSRLRKWIRTLFLIPTILLIFLFALICFYCYGTIDFFGSIFDIGIRQDYYSIYVLKDSLYNKIEDLEDKYIATHNIEDKGIEKSIDKVSKKIEFKLAEYASNSEAVESVINSENEAVLMLNSNMDILKEDNELYSNLRPIYTFSVTTKVETLSSDKNVLKESFVLYISGIDTSGKVGAKARSDVNILVAVNPKTNKILLLNTPRDYYVNLASYNKMDKLTHAGVYGIEESVNTLSKLYNVDVDYYARLNFTTFINVVEKLDGITVDVPVSFCEQTSDRKSTKQICLKKGVQTLNGEQALALSRTRHTISGGDRGRIENQMLVLSAIIDKILSPKIIVNYTSLLNSISDSIVTNVDQKSVTRLIKNQLDENPSWSIETLSTEGTDAYKPTYSTGNQNVYVMEPKLESVTNAKNKLKEILNTN
ncbi:MAG: LCP family protein [Bacilli bacterium]|nr:LCP family protein [Bacilli bacterium]